MQPADPVRLPNTVLTLSRTNALIRNWQVGQIVAATVASRPNHGQVSLRIGTHLVQAQTGHTGLQQGQKLELQVVELGRVPTLKLLVAEAPDVVRAALRSALPRQQPVSTLLSELVQIAAKPANMPAAVVSIARTVLARLPAHTTLSNSDGLRQAVRDSGLFLESRLASGTGKLPDLSRDLKANLLRLLGILRKSVANIGPETRASTPDSRSAPARQTTQTGPQTQSTERNSQPAPQPQPQHRIVPASPAEVSTRALAEMAQQSRLNLVEQTEASLARIRVNQLSSAGSERHLAPDWVLEIPVRRGDQLDTWHFHVRKDGGSESGASAAPDSWSVTIRFNLPGLGPMEARVGLTEDRVSTTFVAEQESTVPVLEDQLPRLRSRLAEQGLAVAHLACHRGDPATAPPMAVNGKLVDEKA